MIDRKTTRMVLGLASLAIGCALLAPYVLSYRLPHPEQASNEQLLGWLIYRDLNKEPREVQVSLIDRLVGEMDIALSASADDVTLSTSQRRRLRQNTIHLKELWFTTRIDRYYDATPDQRWQFLERQIAAVDAWTRIAMTHGEAMGFDSGSASSFFEDIDGWMDAASGPARERMLGAVKDAVICWLATRDLAEQSMETRRALADRIARELDSGMRISQATDHLNADQLAQMRNNSELLMEAWIYNLIDSFDGLDSRQEDIRVADQIGRVRQWGVLELLGGSQNGGPLGQLAGALRLQRLFGEWIERADEVQRARMRALRESVIAHLSIWSK